MPTINILLLLTAGQKNVAVMATTPGLSVNRKNICRPFSMWAHWRRIAGALANDVIEFSSHEAMTRPIHEVQWTSGVCHEVFNLLDNSVKHFGPSQQLSHRDNAAICETGAIEVAFRTRRNVVVIDVAR